MSDLLTELDQLISREGHFLWAAGDVAAIKDSFLISQEQDLSGIDGAIVMAFPIPRDTLGGIKDQPTILYKQTYRQINNLLDRTALKVASHITHHGGRSIPIPASVLVGWENLTAHLNHRQVAVHLGLGWYGRNNLLVTRKYGAQVRLVTILHDQPFERKGPETDGVLGCGDCRACAVVCPVGAIHNGPADFDRPSCFERVKQFEKLRGIGQRICGVCVRACVGPV